MTHGDHRTLACRACRSEDAAQAAQTDHRISGIIHMLKCGSRWVDAPSAYGLRKTLYYRFVRWAAKGVWEDIFHALVPEGGPPEQVLIDSSAVETHRCASGGKGGNSARRSAALAVGEPRKSTR